jgi:starch synthase
MAIYSGADLFLMPSKSEPCGLSQMIAMRYGTLPIVRETGGLRDSVQAYEAWRDTGNGFSFANYNSSDMLHVIREAVELYSANPEAFARLRQRAMECDFSWARSADAYLRIYANITGQAWGAERPFEEAAPVEVVEEKPKKKATRKKTVKVEEAPAAEAAAEEKPKKTTRKKAVKAEEAPAAEAVAEEKPKKTTRKKAVKVEEAPAAEAVAEEKPKKTTRKKTAKKETPVEETAEK